jgi:cellulose biosynthesis protein BcsQ
MMNRHHPLRLAARFWTLVFCCCLCVFSVSPLLKAQSQPTPVLCNDLSVQVTFPFPYRQLPDQDALPEIQSGLRLQLADVFALSGEEAAWAEQQSFINIRHVRVKAYTSPASRLSGSNSILPENIDRENIEIATANAELIATMIRNLFPDSDLGADQLITEGTEQPLTEAELKTLNQIATGSREPPEMKIGWIYNMLIMFEKGEPLSESAVVGIRPIVERKQFAEISFCFQDNRPLEPEDTGSAPIDPEADSSPPLTLQSIMDWFTAQAQKSSTTPRAVRLTVKYTIWSAASLILLILAGYGLYRLINYHYNVKKNLERVFTDSQKASRPSNRSAQNRMLAFLSGKGGTGKSSVTASLGYLLAHCGFRTLLVDMDLFTCGLSLHLLSDLNHNNKQSVSDFFIEERDAQEFHPLPIKNSYTRENLYIIPGLPKEGTQSIDLFSQLKYHDLESFTERLKALLETIKLDFSFDFILIDTRGGIDYMSSGAALAAGSYVIITETGKASWEIGERLERSIREARDRLQVEAKCLGFIINKNTLPTSEIEKYLEKKWNLPHLVTIPYAKNVPLLFERNQVTIVEDVGCSFSRSILTLVDKILRQTGWSNYNSAHFEKTRIIAKWYRILRFFNVRQS